MIDTCKAFPEQVHDFLAEFAPPNQDKESQVSSQYVYLECGRERQKRQRILQRRIAEQNKVIKKPRNEHVPYLTPGDFYRC